MYMIWKTMHIWGTYNRFQTVFNLKDFSTIVYQIQSICTSAIYLLPWSYMSPNFASMNIGYITQSIIRQTNGLLSPPYLNTASSLISSVITEGSDVGFNCLIGIISKPYWCLPDTLMSFQVRLHNFCILVTKSLNTLLSHPFKEVFISKYLKQKRCKAQFKR